MGQSQSGSSSVRQAVLLLHRQGSWKLLAKEFSSQVINLACLWITVWVQQCEASCAAPSQTGFLEIPSHIHPTLRRGKTSSDLSGSTRLASQHQTSQPAPDLLASTRPASQH